MRVAGTCSSRASLLTERPRGFMKSSRRISPGWTGGIDAEFLAITCDPLMVVNDLNIVGMTFARLVVAVGAAELADDVADEVLGVTEEHQRAVQIIEGVVDSGEARGHAALYDHYRAGF